MGEDGDEDSDVAFAFRCAGAESIASPPFAQNAKDGPPATRRANVVRKMVRGLPIERVSYTEFVSWLRRYEVSAPNARMRLLIERG